MIATKIIKPGFCYCFFALLLNVTVSHSVAAQGLYMEQVKAAKPDKEAQQEALKQVEERVEIEIKDALSVSPFHKRVEALNTHDSSLCMACHIALPHQKLPRSRAFLNMHTRYVACTTCHFKPENTALEYEWRSYNGEHNDESRSSNTAANNHSIVPFDGAKITARYNGKLIEPFLNSDVGDTIKAQWQQASDVEKANLKASLHLPLDSKGAHCNECHYGDTPKGLINLTDLGANSAQRQSIRVNTIAQFFTRYKKRDDKIRMTELLDSGRIE